LGEPATEDVGDVLEFAEGAVDGGAVITSLREGGDVVEAHGIGGGDPAGDERGGLFLPFGGIGAGGDELGEAFRAAASAGFGDLLRGVAEEGGIEVGAGGLFGEPALAGIETAGINDHGGEAAEAPGGLRSGEGFRDEVHGGGGVLLHDALPNAVFE